MRPQNITQRNEPGFNLAGFDPLPPPVSLGGGGEKGPGRSPSSCHRTSSAATDQATFCCCNVILPQSACQPKAQVYVISMSLLQQQPGECLPVFLPAWMLQGTRGGLPSSGWLSSLFPALRILLFLCLGCCCCSPPGKLKRGLRVAGPGNPARVRRQQMGPGSGTGVNRVGANP